MIKKLQCILGLLTILLSASTTQSRTIRISPKIRSTNPVSKKIAELQAEIDKLNQEARSRSEADRRAGRSDTTKGLYMKRIALEKELDQLKNQSNSSKSTSRYTTKRKIVLRD